MPKEDLFEIRAQKLEAFEDSGGVAFPRGFDVDASLGSVAARFANHDTEELRTSPTNFRLAGRIQTKREHGKTSFSDIGDGSGCIQLYVRQDNLGEEVYDAWQTLDIGD